MADRRRPEPDRPLPHVDVAGWLLGDLDPAEHTATRAHLATCATCREEADELRATADLALLSGPTAALPADLADRIVSAISNQPDGAPADAAATTPAAPPSRDPASTRPGGRRDDPRPTGRPRHNQARWARPVATAVVAVVAIVAAVFGLRGGQPGVVELDTQLVAASGGGASVDVVVRRLDTGRAVDVSSESLPILPDAGLYELWFVGPGDAATTPNRVSAGTFHPDEDGITQVVLHAAVVPDEYPIVVITAEPKDGDPAVNGPEVVRSTG